MLNNKTINLPYPKISDDYLDEHYKLLRKVEQIPFIATMNWWIIDFFVSKHNTELYPEASKQGTLKSKCYRLTDSEISFINNGSLDNVLQNQIDDLVIHFYKYHLKFKYEKPSSIASTYAEILKYLRSVEPHEQVERRNYILEGKGVRKSSLRDLLLRNINELNIELEYRISELGFNLKDLLKEWDDEEYDDEEEQMYSGLYLPITGYHLVNPDRFENKLRSIYKLLVPKFLNSRTTSHENLEQLFGLNKKFLIKPMIWIADKNELNYFFRKLKSEGKITDKHVHQIAQRVFVNPNLETITNISNSKKNPSTSQQIDDIIKLF
ncbi:hypothetical protein PP182_02520 [Maribacter sp. PR1]|uniref:Uncharacterized protein n=1 Tax=Maribacter cobaltidurans TaxID=1178778 RepID=A0ABU7IPP7_9FLAO|nr:MULTISPECIES: hypothetical protein [Maribacter]MDC6387540.1 hypothetical protein [Maribacter sp. PR1]MEE1974927.1 hypothetical protein [Maribacter cobaltidurans]